MKTIKATVDQTLFDIAIQETGSIETVFDILDLNPGMVLDCALQASTVVYVPDTIMDPKVVDYFTFNNIKPVSSIGADQVITQNDLNNMKQDFDYDLSGGDHQFAGVRLFFLHDQLSVQIVYNGITADTVVVSVDQSLDGVNWTTIPYVNQVLDKTKPAHTFNIIGLLTDYVRLHVEVPDASDGVINSVTWKT